MTDYYPESTARFRADTTEHQMTVLHDDGLYRHLRFKPAGRSFYWFDLVTWPGKLAFVGDGEGFVFSRLEDMFEFVRMSRGRINPGYWAEKLVTNQHTARAHSVEKFNERMAEALSAVEDRYPGAAAAWAGHVEDYDVSYAANAREALADFRFVPDGAPVEQPPLRFEDAWEWDFQDWHWWFLWACQGIAWGISQYDTAKAEKAAREPAEAVAR
jgi:hypothetical protein